jgi:hypothetical protein
MLSRLLISLGYVSIPALILFGCWWTDDEVAARRRAWLKANVPAWVWAVPEVLEAGGLILCLLALAGGVLWGVGAWAWWVVKG